MKLKKIIVKLINKEIEIDPYYFFARSNFSYFISYAPFEFMDCGTKVYKDPTTFKIISFVARKDVISKILYEILEFKFFESRNLLFPWTISSLICYFIFPIRISFYEKKINQNTAEYSFHIELNETWELLRTFKAYSIENSYFKNFCIFLIYLTIFKSLLI